MLVPLHRWREKRLVTVCLLTGVLVSSILIEGIDPGSGIGADCILPEWSPDLAPVYGRCRETQEDSVQVLSFGQSSSTEEPKWIVLWKNTSAAQQLSKEACREAESTEASSPFQGACTIIYSSIIPGLAISLSKSQLLSFLATYNGSIASVHEDTSVSTSEIQLNPPWSLDRLDQTALPLDNQYHYYNLASGVNAYIIDTGIRTTHKEFRYIDGTPGSRAREVHTSLSSGSVGQDCNGHGTHVAGTVGGLTYGPAKNVTLLAVRALECLGNGTVSQVIEGLDWVRANHQAPAVAVMALGGDAQYALDLAVHNLVAAGVPVMVAAGNDDTDACSKSPAREPLATTVSAIGKGDERLWISPGTASNFGPCVKVWAPGSDIQSASTSSDSATEFRSGTSQAAPYAAGAIALYLQNHTDASPTDIASAINFWGSWGQITEASRSSTNGTAVLSPSAANVLLNLLQTAPVLLNPTQFTLQTGSLGPFRITVALTQVLLEAVAMNVSLSDPLRGSVTPSMLVFDASNWSQPQQVTLQLADAALSTAKSSPLTVQFLLESNLVAFHGQQPRAWVFDKKGDVFSYPKIVSSLPFNDSGNTYLYENSYSLGCGAAVGQGREVVYFFQPAVNCNVTISLCGSRNTSQPIDTLLFVLADLLSGDVAGVECNDDFCGQQSQVNVEMTAGVGYGIVVDSKNGQYGTYSIAITANEGDVMGVLPTASVLLRAQQNVPQSMIVGSPMANSQPYAVSNVYGGRLPVPPFPPPPPSPSIGTIPGPPAPDQLPPLLDSTGAAAGLANLPAELAGKGGEVATSSTAPQSSQPGGAAQEPPSALPPASVPASGPFQVVRVTGPSRSPPPPPPAGPPLTSSSLSQGTDAAANPTPPSSGAGRGL